MLNLRAIAKPLNSHPTSTAALELLRRLQAGRRSTVAVFLS
jgi:hypothetical protein